MKRLVPRLDGVIELLMALALTVLLLAVFSNSVLRYVGIGIPAAEEVARLMFVWITFLGAILALRRHALLGIELVQAMIPRPARRVCAVISHVLILYALWLFLVGSWHQTIIGLHTYSTVLGFPMALMASSGLLCSVSMIFIVAVNLWRILTNHPDGRMPGDPMPHHEPIDAQTTQAGAQ